MKYFATFPLVGTAILLPALCRLQPAAATGPGNAAAQRIDLTRQVRPILSEHCFACHGPDDKQRKAKLRLDTKAGAFAALRHGGFAVVAGKPADSELLARVTSAEPTELMPPPKFGKPLTAEQI